MRFLEIRDRDDATKVAKDCGTGMFVAATCRRVSGSARFYPAEFFGLFKTPTK